MAKTPLNPTQDHRIAAISKVGSLAENDLVLVHMSGTEQMGHPFEYQLDLLSNLHTVDGATLLGENVTVRVELPGEGKTRYFNGFVSHFESVGLVTQMDLYKYKITLRPWLWFLTRTANCRIFQNKKVDEIILEIFQDYGFSSEVKNNLTATYPKYEYCVQYRETAFDFVHRLMQEWGIYYYFTHENGSHKLNLVDSSSSHSTAADYDKVPYYPKDEDAQRSRDHVYEISEFNEVQPGTYVHTVFEFKDSRANLETKQQDPKSHALAEFEVFDYPAGYDKTEKAVSGDGQTLASVRHEELHARHQVYRAAGDARGLQVGFSFNLEYDPLEKNDYVITGMHHELHNTDYTSGGGVAPLEPYTCTFSAIQKAVQFRSPQITPKPVVKGPQTAIVVGKSGEEIDTDEHGRVKVKFPWDRGSNADENSSCWIRVAQVWAGKKWGAMYIPRIGHEVIVDFLEGDPDRPIITGRVYNDDTKPPYDLPANKTQSTLKSNSSKGGGGFNEIRFEDKKDSEQIFIHAQKDQDVRVNNIYREWVGNEHHLTVKKKQLEMIEGEKHLSVKAGEDGEGDYFQLVEGDKHIDIGGNKNILIGDSLSLEATSDIDVKAGGNYALDASDIHIKAGSNMVLEAGTKLTLKVGGNFVVISSAGVDIKGSLVNINSGGSAGNGAGSSPEAPEPPEEPTEPTGEPGETASASGSAGQIAAATPGSVQAGAFSPQAQALQNASDSGAPFCEECEKARKELEQQKKEQQTAPTEGQSNDSDSPGGDDGNSPPSTPDSQLPPPRPGSGGGSQVG